MAQFATNPLLVPRQTQRGCLSPVANSGVAVYPQALQGAGRAAMDSPWVGVAAFACGWLLREWFTPKCPDPQVCRCECKVAPQIAAESSSPVPPFWLIIFGAIVVLAVFGNTALALKVSYQDSTTGTDRTVSVNVKGKSKGGVYGSAKGLQISN